MGMPLYIRVTLCIYEEKCDSIRTFKGRYHMHAGVLASYSRPIKNRPGIDCLRMRHIIRIFISKIFRYIRWSINGRAIQRKYPYTHVATIICSGFAWRSL